jgi:hypothetical protein
MMTEETGRVLWGLPIIRSDDAGPDPVERITGTAEFHNFESIVGMMEVLAEVVGDSPTDEEWDELCARVNVDPVAQREFRQLLRRELGDTD